MRAPSQAAINAAILAAQRASGTVPDADDDDSSSFYSDEGEEEEEEGSSEGEEAPAAAAAGKKGGEGGAAAQPSGARLQTNRVLTPEEFILGELAKQAGGVSVHTQATWPGAAMLVLTKASGAAGLDGCGLCSWGVLRLGWNQPIGISPQVYTCLGAHVLQRSSPPCRRCCAWSAPLSLGSPWI